MTAASVRSSSRTSNASWLYSRELSVKVFAGQCRLIEHGFHRTDTGDINALISAVLEFGARRSAAAGDGLVVDVARSPPLAI
jgi:hypothetical protein